MADVEDPLKGLSSGEASGEASEKRQDESKDETANNTRKLLEHLTDGDLENLVEEYTVTGLENLEENPDLIDDLYQMLKIDDDPLEMDDSNLDLLLFPKLSVTEKGVSADLGKKRHLYYSMNERGSCLVTVHHVAVVAMHYIFFIWHLNMKEDVSRKATKHIRDY